MQEFLENLLLVETSTSHISASHYQFLQSVRVRRRSVSRKYVNKITERSCAAGNFAGCYRRSCVSTSKSVISFVLVNRGRWSKGGAETKLPC